MIRHILLISFTNAATPADILAVKRGFLHITQLVVGVTSVEWGINDSPEEKNAGFTHCVLMTFADEAARQRYLPHSAHKDLKAIFRPILQDIIVQDYTLNP